MAAKKILVVAVGTGGTQRNIIQNPGDDLSRFRRTILRGLVAELGKKHTPYNHFNIDYVQDQPGKDLAASVAHAIDAPPPDLIFPIGSSARTAAQRWTKQYPTVFVAISDPAEDDAVDSLRNPGRNATGVCTCLRQTAHICLQRFVNNVRFVKNGQQLKTVLALHQPFFPPVVRAMPDLRRTATTLGVEFEPLIVWNGAHLNEILSELSTIGAAPRGLLMVPDDLVASEGQNVIKRAHDQGISTFVPQLEFVQLDAKNPQKPCALGAFGILGDTAGQEAAELVEAVLWGGQNAGVLPVKELDDEKKYFQFWWNNEVAKLLGCRELRAREITM